MEFATGAVGRLLPKLCQLLKEEYMLKKSVRKDIVFLERELESIQVALRKVAEVPRAQLDEQAKLWARDVRELSYDIEDAVDTFMVRVEGRREEVAGGDPSNNMFNKLGKKAVALFRKGKTRHLIADVVRDMKAQIQDVADRRERYKIDSVVATTTNQQGAATIDPRLSALYRNEKELVGIKEAKDELITMLTTDGIDDDASSYQQLKTISIVGIGGLGKTTLAREVYDRLKPQFDCKAFVPIGRNPDFKKVFRDILIDLDKEKYTNLNVPMLDEKQLIDEVREFLHVKRYLIIIDDIWDTSAWVVIKNAMVSNDCGSRIITTTRKSNVATEVGDVYKLKNLSEDDSKKLLYARLFGSSGGASSFPHNRSDQMLEAPGKILKKCGGVPLAIITIASLLATKPVEEWSRVYNSIGFVDGDNEQVKNTREILSFSYYELPSYLKTCLLYLSLFTEDQYIWKGPLIRMWIAEGFVDAKQGIGLFELGEMYFNELINRSMIQPVEIRDQALVIGCHVHDMVLDLIRSLSREENIVTVLGGGEHTTVLGSSNNARRLAIQNIDVEDNTWSNTAAGKSQVRSLVASLCDICAVLPLCRFRVLRVLAVEYCDFTEKNHLKHLGGLPHLRYLGLNYSRTVALPEEIGRLKFLQTLDLEETGIEELPPSIGLLTQLVCLRGDEVTRPPLGDGCGIIGRLAALEELWIYPDANHESAARFVKELGNLTRLRTLRTRVAVQDKGHERALLDCLANLQNLQSVRILGGTSPWTRPNVAPDEEGTVVVAGTAGRCRFVLGRRLHYLNLAKCIRFCHLPPWIDPLLLPNLRNLFLSLQAVHARDLQVLGRMPELRHLALDVLLDAVICFHAATGDDGGSFHKLRCFCIRNATIRVVANEPSDGHSAAASGSSIMPSLENLELDVSVQDLKAESSSGFVGLLTTLPSLDHVRANFHCTGETAAEVEEAEAVLRHAVDVHSNRPTLQVIRVK